MNFDKAIILGDVNSSSSFPDESLIKKLKEIYKTGDIALLTFYEFIWIEEHYDLYYGFISSLKNYKMYNFFMRDNIKKVRDENEPKIKRKNKISKMINRKINSQVFRTKNNKKMIVGSKKLSLWKTFIPCKDKKTNNYKFPLFKLKNK